MPTRKIDDSKEVSDKPCNDPGHNVPSMAYFSPGRWEHECPKCKNKIIFMVPASTL